MKNSKIKQVITIVNILYLIIIIILPNILYSQSESQIKFEYLIPMWQHTIIDSSLISDHPQGKDVFTNESRYKFKDSTIYIANSYQGQFFGAYFEKISTINGKKYWSTYFDKRNIDKMETVSSINLSKNDLEVLCFRAKTNSIFNDKNKFSRWIFDNKTGNPLQHEFAEFQDTTSPILISNMILISDSYLYTLGDKYIYISPFKSSEHKDSADVYSYYLDSLGTLIKKNFLYDLKKKYSLSKIQQFYKINQDKFLSLRKNANTWDWSSDTAKLTYYFDIFNKEMQPIFTQEIEGLEYKLSKYTSIGIKYADDELFVIESNDEINERLYFYDYQGNLINKYDIISQDSSIIYLTAITKLNDDTFLLSGTTFNLKPDNNNYLNFFKIDLKEELELLKRFKVIPKNHFWDSNHIIQLENDDIILGGIYGYNEFENGEFKRKAGNWHSWLRIKAEDLGLKTSTEQISPKEKINIKLFPNPVKNQLTIDFQNSFTGTLEILDEFGRFLFNQKLKNIIKKCVDVSKFPKGAYFIKIMDDRRNNQLIIKSFVIQQ